jgi:cellulose biosynthesis protein BcsQ
MGSAIMVANMKGGVGKSTLTCYLADYFRKNQKKRTLSLIDTDVQGSTFEMLQADGGFENLRHLPIGDRYDAVNVVTVDTIVRNHLGTAKDLLLIDTCAGKPDSICQIAMMCHCLLVPVSINWGDIRPTRDFIEEIQDRKDSSRAITPHIIVVPNRIPYQQRDYSSLKEALSELDVVIAPGLSDLSIVRHQTKKFSGMDPTKGTRFYEEIIHFGNFITEYILGGKLDSIYSNNNVIELRR